MRALIRKIAPQWFLDWFRKTRKGIYKRLGLHVKKVDVHETFTKIYENNTWGSAESVSGMGSELAQTESLRRDLGKLLVDLNISSMLDIPCGDFNWMQRVDLSNVDYTGADIVEDLITRNREKFRGRKKVSFEVLNLIHDPLPKKDLVFVRDCLVHLSNSEIKQALKNIKKSGSKYLLTTVFTDCMFNENITTGNWRKLNLEKGPFGFPKPLIAFSENCTEWGGKYPDKAMALWEISKI
jgi:hypothetical protein